MYDFFMLSDDDFVPGGSAPAPFALAASLLGL